MLENIPRDRPDASPMRLLFTLGLLFGLVASAAEPMPAPRFRAFDSNGLPLAGGKLYSYQAGTSTPLATYTSRSGLVANANPVVLDANGEADVWLAPNTLYKVELRNSAGVLQYSVDQLPATPSLTSLNSFTTGITVTQSNTNAAGVTAAGNGSAPGVTATGGATGTGGVFTGGSTSGSGVVATATGTKSSVIGLGAGAAAPHDPGGLGGIFVGAGGTTDALTMGGSAAGSTGVYAIGAGGGGGIVARAGPAGTGARIFGGTTSGTGAVIAGGPGSPGLDLSAGSGESSSARLEALDISAGDIRFQHTSPASTTAMRNRLSKANLPKAWARVTTTGGGSTVATVNSGFNIASASVSGTSVTVNFAEPFASTSYATVVTLTGPGFACGAGSSTASSVLVSCYNIAGAANYDFQALTTRTFNLIAFGEQ